MDCPAKWDRAKKRIQSFRIIINFKKPFAVERENLYIYATKKPKFMFYKGFVTMKDGIHPEYRKALVTCSCGNTFVTRSTVGNIKVEICSKCHPFFTGQQKLVDSAGRVEKFVRKYAKMAKPEVKPETQPEATSGQ